MARAVFTCARRHDWTARRAAGALAWTSEGEATNADDAREEIDALIEMVNLTGAARVRDVRLARFAGAVAKDVESWTAAKDAWDASRAVFFGERT